MRMVVSSPPALGFTPLMPLRMIGSSGAMIDFTFLAPLGRTSFGVNETPRGGVAGASNVTV
jgi:hypothetical protein